MARPQITLREFSEGEYELVHPPCVGRRVEDLAEVRAILAAGEIDVAVDELRWLLEGCRPLLEAHRLLGEIALEQDDLELARSHLAAAYELGRAAVAKGPARLRLPYGRPANQAFLQAAKGLALALVRLGDERGAAEVVGALLGWDPSDPLSAGEIPT